MSGSRHNPLVLLLAGALVVAYAALAHYTSLLPNNAHWAVLLAVLPPAVIGFGMLRSAVGGLIPWFYAASALILAAAVWPTLQQNVAAVYFAQHVGMNSAFCLFFGHTLLGDREPLCTHFASLAHDHISPRLARYTRQVTVAWTAFFAIVATTSVLLFCFAPMEAWSLFANLLTLPLVGAMFVVEGAVRRFKLPPEERLGILATIAAYRKSMAMRSSKTPSAS
jgi:uncharacterized membrane protein